MLDKTADEAINALQVQLDAVKGRFTAHKRSNTTEHVDIRKTVKSMSDKYEEKADKFVHLKAKVSTAFKNVGTKVRAINNSIDEAENTANEAPRRTTNLDPANWASRQLHYT